MAFSQAINAFSAAANKISTAGITTASGQNAYVMLAYGTDSARTASFVDNKGNTFHLLSGSPYAIQANSQAINLYYCENFIGGSGHIFTGNVTVTGNSMSMLVSILTGRATSGSIRAFSSAQSIAYAQSHAGATVSAASTDDVLCFSAENFNSNGTETYTVGSGFAAIPTGGQINSQQ